MTRIDIFRRPVEMTIVKTAVVTVVSGGGFGSNVEAILFETGDKNGEWNRGRMQKIGKNRRKR